MLPNWIIVGAPKSGTSSLFQWLADHPEVGSAQEKETYYFVDPGTHVYRRGRNYSYSGLAGYEALFAHCASSDRVILEATPGYLYQETSLRELPRLATSPSFIVMLREPVAQIRSLYRYFQQNWDWIPRTMSFTEFVAAAEQGTCTFKGNELASNALDNADYVKHLRRWRDACGTDRLHVLLFEDLVKDPRSFMAEVAIRMGIDPSFYDTYSFPVENESYVAKIGALQSLNIRLRGLIPQGRTYGLLRRLYRAANTRPTPRQPQGSCPDEVATERRLSQRYLVTLDDLEQEFDLDLSRWRRTMELRSKAKEGQPEASDGLEREAGVVKRPGVRVS